MRARASIMEVVAAVLCIALVSCDKPTGPADPAMGHHGAIELAVRADPAIPCDPLPLFTIDPMDAARRLSPYGVARVRWDYTDDGIWDTGYAPFAVFNALRLNPLPESNEWTAKCEIVDAEGRSFVRRATMHLPDWVPIAPDIIIGEMRLLHGSFGTSQDSMLVAEGFTVCAQVRSWLLPVRNPQTWVACYVDGVLATEWESGLRFNYSPPCVSVCSWDVEGIGAPGRHTISIVFDAHNEIAEVNEGNNERSLEVTVVGP